MSQHTTAHTIAAYLGGDGTVYETETGETLGEIARGYDATVARWTGHVVYLFPDGSRIVDAGDSWDIGFPAPAACLCWPEAHGGDHAPDCEYRRAYSRADLAHELVMLGDVARLVDKPVNTVDQWRRRHLETPRPVAVTVGGAVYLRETGRL